ncbi:MAG: permease-like cell division protein FtsX [Fimbriimonadaceae bacterium]|nr:permease-like cell division protein FtsX [Fimbriimonadaceae bacterium]
MLDRIAFLIGEAAMALRRNGWMTFAAVSTVAVSLFLVGGLGYGYIKIDEYAKRIGGTFEIRAYLQDGVEKEAISATAQKLRKMPGVKSVTWVPRDHAWEKMQKELGTAYKDIENPLPDSYKVILSDVSQGPAVAAELNKVKELQDVAYDENVQGFLTNIQTAIKWLGFTLVALMVLTAGVLIFNAIRLTIVARRREIRIMQLVGAPYLMVRIPFLIEGAVQGLVGGLIGTLILMPCHDLIAARVSEIQFGEAASFPFATMATVLMVCGGLYGLICSALAVAGPMKLERGAA